MKKTRNTLPNLLLLAILGTIALAGCNLSGNDSNDDSTAPSVVSVIPAESATNIALNSSIRATFDEAMDSATIIPVNFLVTFGLNTASVGGTLTYNEPTKTAIFVPSFDLEPNVEYAITINDGVKDIAGNDLATDKIWTFTTGTDLDTAAPVIASSVPSNEATDAALNGNISATFDEPIDPVSVTDTTFTLAQGAVAVIGTVSYSDNTATFNPTANLLPNTVYTATLASGISDMAGNASAVDRVWTFTTGSDTDAIAPTVVSTNPLDAAVEVLVGANVSAVFSEAMDPPTITNATVTLKKGSTNIEGTVSCTGTTVTFNPGASLEPATLYTATITTGAKDLAANALATSKVWTFTTVALIADTTPPTVNATSPVANATGVAVSVDVNAHFSEEMKASTVTATTFTLATGSTPVAGIVSYKGAIGTFNPNANLAYNTLYTATVTTGAQDLAGNALAATKVWNFTTLAAADTTAPTVTDSESVPLDNATGVPLDGTITGTFDEAMDVSTINNATFTLADGTTSVPGNVVYDASNHTATFTPSTNLTSGTLYTATFTTGAKDSAGNALAAPKVWHFTTATVVALGPAPVSLGTAGNYAILAKSAISTVPTSVISGNVGLSPAAETFMTGFSQTDAISYATSTQVINGYKMYAADMADPTPGYLTTAVSYMEAAFTNAANRTGPTSTELGAGTVSLVTFAPGLYKWTSDVTITNDITLNGGVNDVWIFQIDRDLSMASAKTINMTGGAQAKNVFWQVAGKVVLGTTSHFEGTILCYTQIVFNTGASLTGRALAQTAVILDHNTITKPAQ